MAIKPKDIYDGHKKKRSWSTIITLSLLGLLALAVLLFYGLRARCIYDEDGSAHIVFPFTQEAKELKAAKTGQPEPSEPSQPEFTPAPIGDDAPADTVAPAALTDPTAPADHDALPDPTAPADPDVPVDPVPPSSTEPAAPQ